MDDAGDKKELEALKNAAERHCSQMQQAWDQAGITDAFRRVQQANLEKKAAKRAKSKAGPDLKS
jgi:hypothetical protein